MAFRNGIAATVFCGGAVQEFTMPNGAFKDRHLGSMYLAHEVNKAASALLLNAESAKKWLDKSPPDLVRAKRSLDLIIRNGRLVTDIAERYHPSLAVSHAHRTATDVNRLLNDVLGLFDAQFSEAGVSLNRQFLTDLPLISADRLQLEQVFVNLLDNCIEAMAEVEDQARCIWIRTSQVERGVMIAIEDAGEAVPDEIGQHVFDYLYTTKPNGSGLGLALCQEIVAGHGGRIWAERNKVRGTTFHIVLPQADLQSQS
jgi:signal transduction histidine kinase